MTERLIKGYHAHIYYDPETRSTAAKVRGGIAASFSNVLIGSWHDEPVGPHPKSMYQVAFATAEFANFVPWLMLNREGLTVLVHPSTGESLGDHLDRSLWMGEKLQIREDVLRRG